MDVLSWEFDGAGNWKTKTVGAASTTFGYDSQSNMLLWKDDGTQRTFYHWDNRGQLVARSTDSLILADSTNLGSVIDSLYYDPAGRLVRRVISVTSGPQT